MTLMPSGLSGRTSEDRIVALLRSQFGASNARLLKGIGDDAAVIRPRGAAEDWIITTDMLVEDVDFRRDWMSPRELGHRALAANLSDVAAMGARPRFFVISLGLPPGISKRWIHRFYSGMTRLGNACGAFLAGGDLSRSPGGILISITVLGESLQRKFVCRSGGRPGDFIYVTGILGRAATGLRLLQRGLRRGNLGIEKLALSAQRTPEPRCSEGLWLAQSGFVRCMMDISDGLSVDLPRMCGESGAGAEIYTSCLPLFSEAAKLGFDPLDLALHGGEDFELLFCVSLKKASAFEARYPARLAPVTCVGRLTGEFSITQMPRPGMRGLRLFPRGFDHFRQSGRPKPSER